MEENKSDPATLPAGPPGEPSTVVVDSPEMLCARHLPTRSMRARFQTTNSIVVLVALGVMFLAITDIVLQLVAWAVLTAR